MSDKYKIGTKALDISNIKTVDLISDMVSKMSKTRQGFEPAVACFLRLTPDLVERIGINPAVVEKAQEYLDTNNECDEALPAAEKIVELLHETRLHARHELAGIIAEVAAQARRRAERDPKGEEILAALEELLEYHYGPAAKAVATREKAKEPKEPKAPEKPSVTTGS